MSTAIRPFTFDVPQSELDNLKKRLALTRWPERETPHDWSQGIPLAYTREVCEYWRSQCDRRRCETRLNSSASSSPKSTASISSFCTCVRRMRPHDRWS